MQASQPAFFKQGPKPLTRFFLFSVLSVSLIVGDANYQMLGPVRQQLSILLYPLQWLVTAPFEVLRDTSTFLSRQAELLGENRKLHDAQLLASVNAMKLKSLEAENARLRQLNSVQASQPSQLTEILYNGRDPFTARLIVDRGERAKISEGQIVVDASGVVGQVVRVQSMTSEVRLISDRNHMVPVQIERNQLRTVIYGMGRGLPLEIRNMSSNSEIKEGDILITSGIDGLYPQGLPVAKVQKIERNTGNAFARIYCTPLAGIEQHRFLLILDHNQAAAPYPANASETAGAKKKKGR
ncbi:rod shape-determining protein MreC [Iodobacter sp. HSC-16F04]|uniref:Cell shape-determining protein MreC n=1 Tax=Iodobacter violaceini TaxID=3044271 RepID=A0ABX0L205_9NEIS|nr:rod shape-determining protein MreC [Iodobacter violacea]NHQ88244.1 rod shape-determining protein MreC [Iodobacter violacea]